MYSEKERFRSALSRVLSEEKSKEGIGRLGEKTLHAVLKDYIEPDRALHEVRVGSRVADIKRDGHIFEIQSAGFNLLRGKLDEFLKENRVTVVYPLPATKYIIKISSDGAFSKPRKSPRSSPYISVFSELYKIKGYLAHPNFSLRVIAMDIDEYRLFKAPDARARRGRYHKDTVRFERIPTAIVSDDTFYSPEDYLSLLGVTPPEEFTVKELSALLGATRGYAYLAVNVLFSIGALERCPNRGREYVYRVAACGGERSEV